MNPNRFSLTRIRTQRRLLPCATLLAALLGLVPLASSAESVAFETLGKIASLELPAGFCNITKTARGIAVQEFLLERSRAAGLAAQMPEARIIFAPCNEASGSGYPWGWIGAMAQDATGMTQADFNEYIRGNLGTELAAVEEKLSDGKTTKSLSESTGIRIEAQEMGKPLVLTSNNDLHLFSVTQATAVNNQQVNEVILTGSMVRDGRVLYLYAYELQDRAQSVLELAGGINEAAASLTVR